MTHINQDNLTHTNSSPAWDRIEDQIKWYDNKSKSDKKWHKILKITQVSLGATIPASNLLPAEITKFAIPIIGIAITILETIQQINQYPTRWIAYRSTAERLKQEKYLFLSNAGPYKNSSDRELQAIFAERIEEILLSETSSWLNETNNNTSIKKPTINNQTA